MINRNCNSLNGKRFGNPLELIWISFVTIAILPTFLITSAGPCAAKPIDPGLVKFLAPTVKHAIGMRQIPPEFTSKWIERFGREPAFVQSFSFDTSWPDFRESTKHTLTDHWPMEKATYVYSCQMLRKAPLQESEIPVDLRKKYPKDPMNLEAGADGLYDNEWRWFGQLLNKYSQADLDKLILRPGHEFNGDWYIFSTKPKGSTPEISAKKSECFKLYWRRIHKAVTEELHGKKVRWDFCPAGGKIHTTETLPEIGNAYPGDEYVDIIGIDVYAYAANAGDSEEGRGAWKESIKNSLAWQARFADEHGKMTAIDETNIVYKIKDGKQVGSDDDPTWFEGLAKWGQKEIDAHRLSHIALFEQDVLKNPEKRMWHGCLIRRGAIPGRENQESNFPKSAAKIIELFGGPLSPVKTFGKTQ